MKRILVGLFTLLVSVIVLEPSLVFANDGLLQINTDINQNQTSKEVYYIEQEEELSKLFSQSVTEQISQKQSLVEQETESFEKNIFIETVSSDNLSQKYQSLLFNPETQKSVTSDYGVQLIDKGSNVSLSMIAMFLLGLSVMSFSIYQMVRQKRS